MSCLHDRLYFSVNTHRQTTLFYLLRAELYYKLGLWKVPHDQNVFGWMSTCRWKFALSVIRVANMFLQWNFFAATMCELSFFSICMLLKSKWICHQHTAVQHVQKISHKTTGQKKDPTTIFSIWSTCFMYVCVSLCVLCAGCLCGECGPIWTWPQLITATPAAIAVVLL